MTSIDYDKYTQLHNFFKKINEKKNYNKAVRGGFLDFSNISKEENIIEPYNTFKKTLDNWVKMIFFRQQYNEEQREKYKFELQNKTISLDNKEGSTSNNTQTRKSYDDDLDDRTVIKLKNKYIK